MPVSEACSVRLRRATAAAHHDAEGTAFLSRLASRSVPLSGYTALAVQHYAVYEALEAAADGMRWHRVAGGFVDPALTRLPSLAADLRYLLGAGWRESSRPSPATAAYVSAIQACSASPIAFIAHHYVRYLGDLSGGLQIGSAVLAAYDLAPHRGAAFYTFPEIQDPVAFKRAYRARLDALELTPAEQDELVAEACLAYRHNVAVLQQLNAEFDEPVCGAA